MIVIGNVRLFIIKVNKTHFPKTPLEKCDYQIKKTEMENHLVDELDPS